MFWAEPCGLPSHEVFASAPEIDIGESATWAGIGVINATSRPIEGQGWETCEHRCLEIIYQRPKSGIHLLPNWFQSEMKTLDFFFLLIYHEADDLL